MHHHRVHAHQFEQHHVFGKGLLQGRVGHGVAAVFDHQRLAVKLADVGHGLREDLGLVVRRNGDGGGGVGHGENFNSTGVSCKPRE